MAAKKQHEQKEAKTRRLITNKYTEAEDFLEEKYDFRRNSLSLEIEISPKGEEKWEPVNENSLYRELQLRGKGIALNVIIAMLRSNFVKEFDPIYNYFNSLKYDGKKHIDKLAGYVKAADQVEWQKHFKKQLVRAVACALIENYFNKQALIIVHEKQNSGKSTFIRFRHMPLKKKTLYWSTISLTQITSGKLSTL